ncbi:hypothetical protein EsH8_II_000339 [Colletotrichum jinshuiense]
MDTRMPSLKAICRGLVHFIVFALLIDVCQARGKDYKKLDGRSDALKSLTTTDETTLSLSASEHRQGRVVTSIVTTYVLVTLPCGPSEFPPSIKSSPTVLPIPTLSSLIGTSTSNGSKVVSFDTTTTTNSVVPGTFTDQNTTPVDSTVPVSTITSLTGSIQSSKTIDGGNPSTEARTDEPPKGVEPTTWVTWTSSEVTKTTTKDGLSFPTIFPVWVCGGGQLLCKPDCIIPFLFCGNIQLPGPLGFPWAKPPNIPPPKGKPSEDPKPDDPEDTPEPSKTQSPSKSAEPSCTKISFCDQNCFVSQVAVTGTSTIFTTSCLAATCEPSVVCSKTLGTTTTTTTYSTHTATPTPKEQFCGDKDSWCLSCEKGSELAARQAPDHGFHPDPDPEILDGPKGLTHPDTWPQGRQNWWDRTWAYVERYCPGLARPRVTLEGETVNLGYSTMRADVWEDKPLAGSTGPFWGCSGILIVTKRGIYTSHVWEVPNFSKGSHSEAAFDWDAEFDENVLGFLKKGSGDGPNDYPGFDQLKESTPIFDNIVEDTIAILLIVPSGVVMSGSVQFPPNYDDFPARHQAKVNKWTDFISNELGFPREKVRDIIYVKGPSYWPNHVSGRHPMQNYKPPYGLLYWQYHPSSVTETLPDGREIRKPTIRVWYERFLLLEQSWCLGGTVAARDEGGFESCPMPSAPVQPSSLPSRPSQTVSVPISAIGSGNGQTLSGGTISATITTKTSALASSHSSLLASSSSSKAGHVVVVTATAEVTVTEWLDETTTVMAPSETLPGFVSAGGPIFSKVKARTASAVIPSVNPRASKRVVRISQDIAFGMQKSNHTAIVSVYELDGQKENILITERDIKSGGPVDLPSELAVRDNKGGQLFIKFVTGWEAIELESKMEGRVQKWNMLHTKDAGNPATPWCEILKSAPGEGVLKRDVACWYEA